MNKQSTHTYICMIKKIHLVEEFIFKKLIKRFLTFKTIYITLFANIINKIKSRFE